MRSCCDRHPRNTPGCADCRRRNTDYTRARRHAVRDGRWEQWVTGEQLEAMKQHLRDLLELPGVTRRVISHVSGVTTQSISRILLSDVPAVSPQVASALLHTTADACLARARSVAAARDWVDSTGAARRLQALAADSWDTATLADLGGFTIWELKNIRAQVVSVIRKHLHERIRGLYEKIQSQADPSGPSPGATQQARRWGYLLPERWADEDIDNPDAQPLPPPPETEDHVAVTRMIEDCLQHPEQGKAADLSRDVKRELARHARNRLGWSWEQLAWLFGYKSPNTVIYLLQGRSDRQKQERKARDGR